MAEGRSVVMYQRGKSDVSNAITEVKGHAERMEGIPADEYRQALYDLLESIRYLEEVFEGFAYENIPE